MPGERRKLIVELDIYGVDGDADPAHVAQALGFPIGEPIAFDGLDGYDDDEDGPSLHYDTTDARWVS